jgi:hypothetical protein
VELTIKSLDATRMHDPDTASWYHLVERAFAATLSDDTRLAPLNEADRCTTANVRLTLAHALEAEAVSASPVVTQWLQEHWPSEKRGFPAVRECTAKQAEIISASIATYREQRLWLQKADAIRDPALRRHLEEGTKQYRALVDCRSMVLDYVAHKDRGRVKNKSALRGMTKGYEVTVAAMKVGLRALEAGDKKAHGSCMKICRDVSVITAEHSPSLHLSMVLDKAERDVIDRAVEQLLKCAQHSLLFIVAELDGNHRLASVWSLAATIRELALDRSVGNNISAVLKPGQEKILQRADALAKQAREESKPQEGRN